ncbi:MAG: serine hydrolase [Burkholderiales bacterium]|nr:serine hydrolase [Burkholderiales bacterium]
MNTVLSVAALVEILGWPLLHFIWQGVLIACLTALGCAFLRNARPHSRYALACLGLGLCLLWPAFGVYRQIVTPASMSLDAALALVKSSAGQVDIVFRYESELAASLQRTLPWLVTGWMSGVAFMLCRMALGLLWIRGLGQAIASDEQRRLSALWQARTSQLALELDLSRSVQLKVDSRLHSPLTTGCWQPVIVMPLALLSGMPPDLIDALLAHELAHIKRWDYAVNLLQNLVLSLLFYHPAVWWIARRIDIEREQIADDIAAGVLAKPRDLALALQKLDHLQYAALAQAANGGQLLIRIKRLIRPDQQPWRWSMAAPVLGVLVAAALLLAYQHPAPEPVPAAARLAGQGAQLTAYVKTHSQHVLVLDEASGRILLQKDADASVPIASLSKLMTAMVTLDAGLDMQESITISAEDVPLGLHSKSRLPVGLSLSRQALLDLMLIPSDNRAAKALARTYPGGEAGFLAAVQRKIQALRLQQTVIEEPTGISPRNTSSATDLARLAAAASAYPEISRLTTTSEHSVRIKGKDVAYQNSNPLIGQKDWDIVVAKTGFSRDAGRCMLLRAKIAGKNITMVLLNAQNPDLRNEDVGSIRRMVESMASLTPLPPPKRDPGFRAVIA